MARVLAAAVVGVTMAVAACGGATTPERTAPAPAGPRLTAATARSLDAQLKSEVADAGVPGASAAIGFPDGREWTAATGAAVLRPPAPWTPRTSVTFDSVTKIATAALALRL